MPTQTHEHLSRPERLPSSPAVLPGRTDALPNIARWPCQPGDRKAAYGDSQLMADSSRSRHLRERALSRSTLIRKADIRQSESVWQSLSARCSPRASLFKMAYGRLDVDSTIEKNICKSKRVLAKFSCAKEEYKLGCIHSGGCANRPDFSQLMFGQHRKRHD
jgi:hypothetical protein